MKFRLYILTILIVLSALLIAYLVVRKEPQSKIIKDGNEKKESVKTHVPTDSTPLPFPIAYTSERDGQKEIYIAINSDSDPFNISRHESDDNSFLPWRDGGVFVSQRDGNHEIYYAHFTKKLVLENLTQNPAVEKQIAISMDLHNLLFTSTRDGDVEIFAYLDDDYPPLNITRNEASDEFPVWMFDSSEFLFESDREGDYEIFLQGIMDNSKAVNLTQSKAMERFPSVSPDGQYLAFESDRDGYVRIYLFKFADSTVERLSDDSGSDNSPIFSHDSKSLAFNHVENGLMRINLMNLSDRSSKAVTDFEKIIGISAFSPDDKWLLFVSKRTGNLDIFIMRIDGSGAINVSLNDAPDYYPVFFPSTEFPLIKRIFE